MDLMWEFLLLLFFGCSTTTTSLLQLAAEATAGSWSKGVVFKAVNWATGFASSRVWSLPTEKALDDLGAETRRAHRAAAWKVSFVIVFMLPDDWWCDECAGLWTMDYAKISMIFWRLDLHSSLLAHQFSSLLNIVSWIIYVHTSHLARLLIRRCSGMTFFMALEKWKSEKSLGKVAKSKAVAME